MNVVITGKIRKVDLGGLSLENKCKEIHFSKVTKEENKKLPKRYSSFIEAVTDMYFAEYVVIDGALYEYLEVKDTPVHELLRAKRDTDGVIDFIIGFNNSAETLNEHVGEIIEVAGYTK